MNVTAFVPASVTCNPALMAGAPPSEALTNRPQIPPFDGGAARQAGPTESASNLGPPGPSSRPSQQDASAGGTLAHKVDRLTNPLRTMETNLAAIDQRVQERAETVRKVLDQPSLSPEQRELLDSVLNDSQTSRELLVAQREMHQFAMITELASKTVEMATGTVSRVSQMQT